MGGRRSHPQGSSALLSLGPRPTEGQRRKEHRLGGRASLTRDALPCAREEPSTGRAGDSPRTARHWKVTEMASEKLLCPVPEVGSRNQHCQYQVSPVRADVL